MMSNALSDRSEQVGPGERRQLNKPRIAEMIADSLRRRILGGALADGDALPKMDDLVMEFPVSRPSIREAMRILETEGLVSVRRGNVGGAIVHTPKAETAGYMLGVVLQARRTLLSDLAEALLEFEPACAAKAAEAPDRNDVLVPQLVILNERLEANLADGPAFTRLARRFHDAVVHGSGNTTMALVVGALETLWSDHESNWAEAASAHGDYPVRAARDAVLRIHVKITQAIEDGDAARAKHLAARHLHESQRYVLAEGRQQLVTVSGPATTA
jgi:GntR family transcriptional regulator, transcriptional repressor for pyruvate dehydrogenase complex